MRKILGSFVLVLSLATTPAMAGEAKAQASFSIQVEVKAEGKGDAKAGDAAFAAGKFAAALHAYAAGFAKTKDAAFVYAMAQCHKAMGHKAQAEAMFKMYLSAGSTQTLKYEAEAKAELGMKVESAKD